MSPAVRWGLAFGATVTMVAVACMDALPLGVPGEWTWQRVPLDSRAALLDAGLGSLYAATWAAAVVSLTLIAVSRATCAGRLEMAGWLTGVTIVSVGWALAAQAAAPEGYDLAKWPRVLYYPASSGYFYLVRYEAGAETALEVYRQRVAEGEVLHIGTHPPGLFLLYDAVLRSLRAAPAWAEWLTRLEPASFQAAAGWIRIAAQRQGIGFDHVDEATLFLVASLTLGSWALVIPVTYWTAAQWRGRAWGTMAAASWVFVPAPLIFMPKSDVLFSGLAAAGLAAWVRATRRRSAPLAVLAVLLLWTGATLSLVFAAVGLAAAVIPLLEQTRRLRGSAGWHLAWLPFRTPGGEHSQHRADHADAGSKESATLGTTVRRDAGETHSPDVPASAPATPGGWTLGGLYLFAAALFMAAVGGFGLAYDMNLLKVWWENANNHAAFYKTSPRSYWAWLIVNPVEASFALGPVVTLSLAASGVVAARIIKEALRAWRLGRRRPVDSPMTSKPEPLARQRVAAREDTPARNGDVAATAWAVGLGTVWCYLWLSGKNNGEAARLWVPLFACAMPLCAVGFAFLLPSGGATSDGRRAEGGRVAAIARGSIGGVAGPPSWRIAAVWLALQAVYCLVAVVRVHGFHYP